MPKHVPAHVAYSGSDRSRLDMVRQHRGLPPWFATIASEDVVIVADMHRLAPEHRKRFRDPRINRHWPARRFRLGLVNLTKHNTPLNQETKTLPVDIAPAEPEDFTDSKPKASSNEDNGSIWLFQFIVLRNICPAFTAWKRPPELELHVGRAPR